MQNNIFLGGTDPLLAVNQAPKPYGYDEEIQRMSQIQQMLEQKKMEMENARESNNKVMAILQREQLRIMRPVVEQSQDGKKALGEHLELVKKLKKEAANENDKAMELFKEYTENYPDMPYADFLKMKRNKQ